MRPGLIGKDPRNIIEILKSGALKGCATVENALWDISGKAANVLRKKGISNAATIHSLIYKPHLSFGEVYWDLAESVPCSGFIVDEASMVSSDIFEDLQSFGIPIIFVGDHGQLEPSGQVCPV